MKLPKHIKIMGIVYDIKEVEKLLDDDGIKKLNGTIRYNTTEILIDKGLSEQLKIITLWHEVIHGLLTQAEVDHKENIVSVLGYGICGFINENPDIFREEVE